MDGFFSSLAKVVTAPVKAVVKVASGATKVPFQVLNKVTPNALKPLVSLATMPARYALSAPLSISGKLLNAVSPGKSTAGASTRASAAIDGAYGSSGAYGSEGAEGRGGRGGRRARAGRGGQGGGGRGRRKPQGFFARAAAAINPAAATVNSPPVAASGTYIPPSVPYAQQAPAPSGGGGGGGGGYDSGNVGPQGRDEYSVEPSDAYEDELPDYGGDEGESEANDPEEISGVDYAQEFADIVPMDDSAQFYGLEGFKDDLKNVGGTLLKGAASGVLQTASNALSKSQASTYKPPAGMSMPAKIAIGVAVGLPVLYLATRRRGTVAT